MTPDSLIIGRCGELLVQQRLLKFQIDSAMLSTDRGIDLLALSTERRSISIQVRSKWKSTPSGGRGRPALDWWAAHSSQVDWYAFVDLARDKIWLMTMYDVKIHDQQPNNPSRHHICMITDGEPVNAARKTRSEVDFEPFLFEKQVKNLWKNQQ